MPLIICPYCRAHLSLVDLEEAAVDCEIYYVCPDCDSPFPKVEQHQEQTAPLIPADASHA